jgi:hypothetical protein
VSGNGGGLAELGFSKANAPKPHWNIGASNALFLLPNGVFKGYAAVDIKIHFRETRTDRMLVRFGGGYANRSALQTDTTVTDSGTSTDTVTSTGYAHEHGGVIYGGLGLNRRISQSVSAELALDLFGDVLFSTGVTLGFAPILRVGILF